MAVFNLLLSLSVTAPLCYVAAYGLGSVPPLGTTLNPSAGIWNTARNANFQSETLHFPSLQRPVTVIFEKNGTPHIQAATQDYLARLIVPKLLTLLQSQKLLTPLEQQGMQMLATWDHNMLADEVAPSIWWNFWQQYVSDTFEPWWQAKHVPADRFKSLAIGPGLQSLSEDQEAWTLNDPTNAAFTLPAGKVRTANDVMLQAYQETITNLTKSLGNDPQQWIWGKLHMRKIDSLLQVDTLAYGPFPSDGDSWTINAAHASNGIVANHGPSCRLIVDWGNKQSELIYPGGQDENPLSPWYQNQITTWWNGQYYPVLNAQQAQRDPQHIIWSLSQ